MKNQLNIGLETKDIFAREPSDLAKTEGQQMPILDPIKKAIAQEHRLRMKICRDCGARNAATATKCRKCKRKNLRMKKRELVK